MSEISKVKPPQRKPTQREIIEQLRPNYLFIFITAFFATLAASAAWNLTGYLWLELSGASAAEIAEQDQTQPDQARCETESSTQLQSLKNQLTLETQRADNAERSLQLARETIANQRTAKPQTTSAASSSRPVISARGTEKSKREQLTDAINAYNTTQGTCDFWRKRYGETKSDRAETLRDEACALSNRLRLKVAHLQPGYFR
jgi:hypothetical protein